MHSGEEELEASSSKRRERLLALRSTATGASPEAPAPPPASAENILPDPDLSGDQASFPHQRHPHRFDYYTNPAAAFSSSGGNNPASWHKRPKASAPCDYSAAPSPPYAGPGNYGSNYHPPYQQHMAPSPVRSPYPRPQNVPGSNPWRSPMQFQESMPGYQGTPQGAPPPPWGSHCASPLEGSYPNSPSFRFRQPNPGQEGNPMNYGPRGSSYSSYGRGPGSSGRGGRGGVGFQNHPVWQDRSSYFNRSMVDDPWQNLQPIVGNILIPRGGGSKSWLPESLRVKDTPAQVQNKSTSGLSLAEYLDLSFNEASNET